jgi:hypothetical protein
VRRQKGHVVYDAVRALGFQPRDGEQDRWCDVWYYEDTVFPLHAPYAAVGPLADAPATTAVTYDDILPVSSTRRTGLLTWT